MLRKCVLIIINILVNLLVAVAASTYIKSISEVSFSDVLKKKLSVLCVIFTDCGKIEKLRCFAHVKLHLKHKDLYVFAVSALSSLSSICM